MTNLQRVRESRRLTVSQLAEAAGVPYNYIQAYEKETILIDNARLVTALRISRALGCAPEELVENQDQLLF